VRPFSLEFFFRLAPVLAGLAGLDVLSPLRGEASSASLGDAPSTTHKIRPGSDRVLVRERSIARDSPWPLLISRRAYLASFITMPGLVWTFTFTQ
jgi:hypothetical protein